MSPNTNVIEKAACMDKSPGGHVVGGGLSEQHAECGA